MAAASSEVPEIAADTDDSISDYDSVYGSSSESATTSLASGVTDYKYENGRRYHAYREGSYWQPNDETQSQQLDLFHHVYSMRLQGELYLAPIGTNPQKILDVGTGTGIWAIDMADKFPTAKVIGNDLSPTQPAWVPPNLTFEVDDANLEWTYAENSFDFVHVRALYGSIDDWPNFVKQAYRVTTPGGYFESVETTVEYISDDGSVAEDNIVQKWAKLTCDAGAKINRRFNVAGHVGGWAKDAGYVDVVEKVYKLPIGSWPKDQTEKIIGTYNLVNMLDAAEGFTLMIFVKVLGWTLSETNQLLEKAKSEMKKKGNHAYYCLHVVYGRKPE